MNINPKNETEICKVSGLLQETNSFIKPKSSNNNHCNSYYEKQTKLTNYSVIAKEANKNLKIFLLFMAKTKDQLILYSILDKPAKLIDSYLTKITLEFSNEEFLPYEIISIGDSTISSISSSNSVKMMKKVHSNQINPSSKLSTYYRKLSKLALTFYVVKYNVDVKWKWELKSNLNLNQNSKDKKESILDSEKIVFNDDFNINFFYNDLNEIFICKTSLDNEKHICHSKIRNFDLVKLYLLVGIENQNEMFLSCEPYFIS